jgi:3',5'-cyclic AMP phosphodiesterase CpdA
MLPVATAIVSDLHLGTGTGADVARSLEARELLAGALAQADRVVVLGDLLELRERPIADVLEVAEATLRAIGEATAGKELVLVAGNHDYELVAPALERARRASRAPLPVEGVFDFAPDDLAGVVASLMPDTRITLAYPAVRIRDDVIAMHGHYLDLHLTVPRPESLLASAIGRHFSGNGATPTGGPYDVNGYEAAVAPLYAFAHRVAQSAEQPAKIQGGGTSRAVWRAVNPDGRPSPTGLLLSKVAIPLGVAALNRAGIGPLRADLSGVELRRAGLRAMGEVANRLAPSFRHVIFGHTHRCGPLPGDVEGWWLPDGRRLSNTGSWLYEGVFTSRADGPKNPYFPGRVTWVDAEGPPRIESLIRELRTAS